MLPRLVVCQQVTSLSLAEQRLTIQMNFTVVEQVAYSVLGHSWISLLSTASDNCRISQAL